MKIILDTDGTLTDFNKFIRENAIDYFMKKYNFNVIYPDALEIEQIFDIENVLMKKYNLTQSEAKKRLKEMLDEYWVSLRFVKFSLFNDFRPGVKEIINEFIKQGHDIEVHTSRAKTCEKSMIGIIARKFTIYQYWKNGIFLPENKFYFYKNDEEKVKNIVDINPDLVFEDKSEIINELTENSIKTICVRGTHNKDIETGEKIEIISNFSKETLDEKMKSLFGKKMIKYYEREAQSRKFYEQLRFLVPIARRFFNPVIVNEENIITMDNEGIIYAPNHRSTLDPVAIMSILDDNIHWAALLRFFEGKDSIFNNSKNPVLCKLTAKVFKNLEYFPIDRKKDNPKANNLDAIRDMNNFLKINSKIGIFGEGTTLKDKERNFGEFDDSFLLLAKKCDAWIQPITTLWLKDDDLDSKVIINFGRPFKVQDMTIEEAMAYFMDIQRMSLEENRQLRDKMLSENENKTKKYFKS